MPVHIDTPSSSNKRKLQDVIASVFQLKRKRKLTMKNQKRKRKSTSKDPVVNLKISDKHVKERTSYDNSLSLLFFVTVACNKDMELMMETRTFLTWFEE